MSSQHDPPFWFSLTAGEVAKRLNKIVDLDVIDRSATWLTGKARKAKIELEVAERRLAEAEAERERLGFVNDLAADHDRLLKTKGRADEITGRAGRLRATLETAQRTAENGALLRFVCEEGVGAEKLGRALDAKQGCLRALREDVRRARNAAEVAGRPVPDLGELESAYNMVEGVGERRRRLSNLLKTIRLSFDDVEDGKVAVSNARVELDEKTEGICPLCGGEWK